MELKISVQEKYDGATCKQTLLQPQQSICAVSCENIIVFTRVLYRSDSFKQSIPVYIVYAADVNTPFETHVIMKSLDEILKVKFNSNGHQLLIVTSLRYLHLYVKGAGLHQWTNTHISKWCEEEILFADFFHGKNRPCIQGNDVKVMALYSEKFQCRMYQPTLKSIGNCPQNGFFVVTASGLFLACTINSSGIVEEEEKAVLGPVRDNFMLASAAFAPDGYIHIAAWKPNVVKCWKIEIGYIERERIASKDGTIFGGISINGNRHLKIDVLSTNFFSPAPLTSDENKGSGYFAGKVTYLSYMDQEDPTSLLIFVEIEKLTVPNKDKVDPQQTQLPSKEELDKLEPRYALQRYQLHEKTRALFQFFLQLDSSEKSNATVLINEWVCQAEWMSPHPITALATPMQNLFARSTLPYVISVASTDGFIYIINRDSMQQISKFACQPGRHDDLATSKKSGKERQIVSLATTWTNLHLVALDSLGGLHVLSLLKQSDVGSTWLVYLLLLLEYSLVSEVDWMDILMAVPQASVATLAERLSDTFHQHPSTIVANLLSRFLVLKSTILRLSSMLHQKSIEARLQAQLSAILKLFHSLRPVTSDVVNVEKNFSALIQSYIENRNSLEILDLDKSIDNLLLSCNILDCQIDPGLGQELQSLLEFSTDLTLYLLLLLVQNPKYELAKEPKILQYLREILFVSRIWFRHNKLVIPQVIRKTDSIDIWAQLYKLLTKLAQIIPNEPDAGFLDDCVILETQVLCREITLFIPPRGIVGSIAGATLPTRPFPLQFYYNEPDRNIPATNVNPRHLEGTLTSTHPIDPLYYHFLGSTCNLLQCTRCFAMRGNWWGTNEHSIWEQEWANRCICSGHWAPLPGNQSTSKAG